MSLWCEDSCSLCRMDDMCVLIVLIEMNSFVVIFLYV